MTRQAKNHIPIIIVGAGASGLIVAHELKRNDLHDFVILEQSGHIGGVYTGLYTGARLVSSNNITYFSTDIPDPEVSRFLSTEEYLAYLRNFSNRNSIDRHITFNVSVKGIKRENSGWSLSIMEKNGQPSDMTCNTLVMCTGLHSVAKKARLNAEGEPYSGVHVHAKEITDLAIFDNRNVLIIGGGEMASDLALFSAERSRKTYVSVRGMGRIVPRFLSGAPLDTSLSRAFHSINRKWDSAGPVQWRFRATRRREKKANSDSIPVHNLLAEWNKKHSGELTAFSRYATKTDAMALAVLNHDAEIKPPVSAVNGNTIKFQDQTSANIDIIVSCLGFDKNPDIFPQELRSIQSNELYFRMFHPGYGADIAFVGMLRPEAGGIPPMSEMQARYLALVLSGKRRLPTPAKMREEIILQQDRDMKQFPIDSCRYPGLTDFFFFLERIAREIGCTPPWGKLMLHPKALWKVLMGPLSVVHYRLRGPGAETKKSLNILKRMTWSRLPPDVIYLFPLFLASQLHRYLIGFSRNVIERDDGYGIEVHTGTLPIKYRKDLKKLIEEEFFPRSPIIARVLSNLKSTFSLKGIMKDFDEAELTCLLTYKHKGQVNVVGSIVGTFLKEDSAECFEDMFSQCVHSVANSVGLPSKASDVRKYMIISRLCVAREHGGRHRSQALIRRLMFEVEKLLEQRHDIDMVELIAQAATEPAIKEFQRAGFVSYQKVDYNTVMPWGGASETAKATYEAAWRSGSRHERLVGMSCDIKLPKSA
ncbi:hypothetical protein BTA51_14680 [Hahella sp. CCB-MM4]|uniref:NAD(P)-binding domain-containing protein n=1 Tax=Hahella sp. (strain CCB-MM4) TaxID=1926491 RepID=UPI000B9AE861|nr:NAD(P)-binding domain-containing protein [Hahella sp. CCB-MM4]OZG72764.1 hypothetical protein BTA51_14680 [Hahella sp. CCB-MM4]